MQEWPARQGKKYYASARWVAPHPTPSGQARFWCPRPDQNGPIQIVSNT
jgi:hypothetical protein